MLRIDLVPAPISLAPPALRGGNWPTEETTRSLRRLREIAPKLRDETTQPIQGK